MMNMAQMQNDMRNLSDEQLQQVVTSPSHPLAPVVALGVLQERQKLRAEHQSRQMQPAQATIADQVMANAMTPQGQPVGPALTSQEPIRMEYGGVIGAPDFNRARQDWRDMLDQLAAQGVPGMIPGADTLDGAMAMMTRFMPDRYGAYNRMAKEYDAGADERVASRRNEALLQLGAGLLNSRRPDALGAIGDAGVAAMPSFLEAQRAPEQEAQAQMERAMGMAGIQSQRDAALAEGGLSVFGQGQDALRNATETVLGLGEERNRLDREEALQREQMANSLAIVRAQMAASRDASGMTPSNIVALINANSDEIASYNTNITRLRDALPSAIGDEAQQIRDSIASMQESVETLQAFNEGLRRSLMGTGDVNVGGQFPPGFSLLSRLSPEGQSTPSNVLESLRGQGGSSEYEVNPTLGPGETVQPFRPGSGGSPAQQSSYGFSYEDGLAQLRTPWFSVGVGQRE